MERTSLTITSVSLSSHCWDKIPNIYNLKEQRLILALVLAMQLADSKARQHGRGTWWKERCLPLDFQEAERIKGGIRKGDTTFQVLPTVTHFFPTEQQVSSSILYYNHLPNIHSFGGHFRSEPEQPAPGPPKTHACLFMKFMYLVHL